MGSWIFGIVALAVLAGCGAASSRGSARGPRFQVGHRAAVSARIAHGGLWRVRTLVPAGEDVDRSELAVSESGDAVVGWLQGPPPQVCEGYGGPCPGAMHWHGQKVMVTQGTVAAGFGEPAELTAYGAGGVYVAQSSSGVAYVAWDQLPDSHPRWRIAAVSNGHVSRPVLLPRGVYLRGLVSGRAREVAAVWDTYDTTHYAFLGASGRLRRQGSVPVVSDPDVPPELRVNDHGELAAVGTHGRDQTSLLVMCGSRGRCSAPLRLPRRPAGTTALSLTDSGTATVLGGGHHGSLWGLVAHVNHASRRESKISAVGEFPVATATGKGAVAIVQPTGDTLAWTFLKTGSEAFTKPRPIPDPKVDTAPVPVLAANLKGEFVAAWGHFLHYHSYGNQPNDQLRASLGSGTTPGRLVMIAPASDHPSWASLQTGIDGRGNALITWSRFASQGDQGLYEAIHTYR